MRHPRYPVYVPSRGRYENNLTARFLLKDECPFRLVIEEPEYEEYGSRYGYDNLLVLPFMNQGLIASRNWIKEHAMGGGHKRHWQLDDNIRKIRRFWKGHRPPINANTALAISEDFIDRYTNVAIGGLNYNMFLVPAGGAKHKPFYLNSRVYSCSLVLNELPHKWRAFYNDDVDICLQVLSDGWCTILLNSFVIEKLQTMKMPGGNTEEYDHAHDGRLKMARSLERMWPGVVTTKRRFHRPQHVVDWSRFDNALIRRPDYDEWVAECATKEEDLRVAIKPEGIKSPMLQRKFAEYEEQFPDAKDGAVPEPKQERSNISLRGK
jgi:hypothetical protein